MATQPYSMNRSCCIVLVVSRHQRLLVYFKKPGRCKSSRSPWSLLERFFINGCTFYNLFLLKTVNFLLFYSFYSRSLLLDSSMAGDCVIARLNCFFFVLLHVFYDFYCCALSVKGQCIVKLQSLQVTVHCYCTVLSRRQ